jgi:hypothetical protein
MSPSTFRSLGLVAFLLVVALALVLLRLIAPTAFDRFCRFAGSRPVWVPTSAFIVIVFGALLVANTMYAGYLDRAEPNIASVSWLLLRGAPLYHPLDYPARYSLLYGPTTYLPFALALWAGGATVVSLKGMVLIANAVMLYFLWRSYRRLFDASASLLVLALVLLFALVPRPNHYLFQVRADVPIMCAMAVGLFAATHSSAHIGALTLALAGACIVDAKATAFVYVIPLFWLFSEKHGRRPFLAAVLCTLGAAALPFALPNISAGQYLQWVRSAGGHPSTLADLGSTLRTLPILAAPLLLICGPTPWRNATFTTHMRGNRARLLALGLCLASAVAASSRIGAGSHHLLPFVPVLGYEYALLFRFVGAPFARHRPDVFRYASVCLAIVILWRVGGGLLEILSPWRGWQWAAAVRNDVHALLRRHSTRKIAMGSGQVEERVTYFRPELVFATDRLPIDEQALCDMNLDGIPLPAATVRALASCVVDLWLIPKGDIPFALDNTFVTASIPRQPLFPPAFRDAFAGHYSKTESTAYFDVWECGGPGTSTHSTPPRSALPPPDDDAQTPRHSP